MIYGVRNNITYPTFAKAVAVDTLQQSLTSWERMIRRAENEVYAIFDSKGNMLNDPAKQKNVKKRKCLILKEEFPLLFNSIVVHNHPCHCVKGLPPPSPGDLTFMVQHGVKEMRIVTTENRYSIKRKKDWTYNDVYYILDYCHKLKDDLKTQTDNISATIHLHGAWKKLEEQGYITYTFESWK